MSLSPKHAVLIYLSCCRSISSPVLFTVLPLISFLICLEIFLMNKGLSNLILYFLILPHHLRIYILSPSSGGWIHFPGRARRRNCLFTKTKHSLKCCCTKGLNVYKGRIHLFKFIASWMSVTCCLVFLAPAVFYFSIFFENSITGDALNTRNDHLSGCITPH